MNKHLFLFYPGQWLGEGKIKFSGSDEPLPFITRWIIPDQREEQFFCTQEVEMRENEEKIQNRFCFFDLKAESFSVTIENEMIGLVEGAGVKDKNKIAWEFKGHPKFEGFEVYEKQPNGEYLFHAEYISPDQFRSIINGRIWLKETLKSL